MIHLSIFQALILGIVQGATEFLPISSSGHLVLVPWWLGWGSLDLAFATTLHRVLLPRPVGDSHGLAAQPDTP